MGLARHSLNQTMTLERARLPVVVTPEGLAFDTAARQALPVPSFVGEAVLKHVLNRYADRRILIAPGNRFGVPPPEHEVMVAYLATRGCARVETPSVKAAGYLDTWRNAVELRRWLSERGEWPLGPIVLVAPFRHASRAQLCFSRNGFVVVSMDTVSYRVNGVPIVPRLFYYNWPRLHQAYEALALVRDRLRPSTREKQR